MKTRLVSTFLLFLALAASARADFSFIFDGSGLFINTGGSGAFGDPLLDSATGVSIFPSANPPRIIGQPVSITTPVGHNVVFVVTVTGGTPLTYHWQKNGANLKDANRISGSHTSILTIVNLQTSDSGKYRVVITNAAGATVSRVATLTVYAPPSKASRAH